MDKREYRRLIHKAHGKYKYALKIGRLRKKPCEVCGERKVDGHHDDYNKPLKVRWLCKKHHRAAHRGLPRDYQFLGRRADSTLVQVLFILLKTKHLEVQKSA